MGRRRFRRRLDGMGPGVRCIAAAVALALTIGTHAAATHRPPSFQIRKPTIIAFFPPLSDMELDADPDMSDALDDFQDAADEVRGRVKKAGVDFEETYTRSFTVRVGAKTVVFRTGKDDVGYYFIAPGKKPHVEYGVMTDDDILGVAHDYFGVPIPGADSSHQAMLVEQAPPPRFPR